MDDGREVVAMVHSCQVVVVVDIIIFLSSLISYLTIHSTWPIVDSGMRFLRLAQLPSSVNNCTVVDITRCLVIEFIQLSASKHYFVLLTDRPVI